MILALDSTRINALASFHPSWEKEATPEAPPKRSLRDDAVTKGRLQRLRSDMATCDTTREKPEICVLGSLQIHDGPGARWRRTA